MFQRQTVQGACTYEEGQEDAACGGRWGIRPEINGDSCGFGGWLGLGFLDLDLGFLGYGVGPAGRTCFCETN